MKLRLTKKLVWLMQKNANLASYQMISNFDWLTKIMVPSNSPIHGEYFFFYFIFYMFF